MTTVLNINKYTIGHGGSLSLPVCSECGAVLYDERQHRTWHAKLAVAADIRPDQGDNR